MHKSARTRQKNCKSFDSEAPFSNFYHENKKKLNVIPHVFLLRKKKQICTRVFQGETILLWFSYKLRSPILPQTKSHTKLDVQIVVGFSRTAKIYKLNVCINNCNNINE